MYDVWFQVSCEVMFVKNNKNGFNLAKTRNDVFVLELKDKERLSKQSTTSNLTCFCLKRKRVRRRKRKRQAQERVRDRDRQTQTDAREKKAAEQ